MIPGTVNTQNLGGRISAVPTYIGNAGEYSSTGGSETITYHASTTTGDFLLLIVQTDDPYQQAVPSGWTSIFNHAYGSTCRGRVMWKFCEGETTVFLSAVSDHRDATVLTFRGVNPTNPVNIDDQGDWGNGTFTRTTGTEQSIPGITTTVDKCFFLLTMFHCYPTAGTAASGWSNANINAGAELADFSTSFGWDGGFASWGGGKLLAGATGDTLVTMLANNYNGPYHVMAIEPS